MLAHPKATEAAEKRSTAECHDGVGERSADTPSSLQRVFAGDAFKLRNTAK